MEPSRHKHSKGDQSSSASESSPQTDATNIQPTKRGINRFPVDCLLKIFHRIPLCNLISLRCVSRIWNSNIIYICAHKERLTLTAYSPAPLEKNEFDLFWIDNLARYLVDRTENPYESIHFSIDQLTKQSKLGLAHLFTGLTELRLHFDCRQILKSHLVKLEILFGHFISSSSPSLKVFSLTRSSKETNECQKGDMFNALCSIASNISTSRLPHLKQLDLCLAGEFSLALPIYSSFDLQAKKYNDMLAKLDRFSLGYHSHFWDVKSTLAKLGPTLVSLSLSFNYKISPYNNTTIISIFDNVKFECTLTHLRLSFQRQISNHDFIRAICGRFLTLELKFVQLQITVPEPRPAYYDFHFGHNFGDQWVRPLSTLKHLSELRLHDFDVSRNCDISLSLPGVKKLTLAKRDLIKPQMFNANLFCRTLATQFPNLEDLVLVCRLFRGDVNQNTRSREVEQQVRHNLNHFAHLRSTVFDFTAPEWS